MGPPFFPANHSSASRAGSGPAVSGYRSSWNRSDWGEEAGHGEDGEKERWIGWADPGPR